MDVVLGGGAVGARAQIPHPGQLHRRANPPNVAKVDEGDLPSYFSPVSYPYQPRIPGTAVASQSATSDLLVHRSLKKPPKNGR
jgi:hypothetical protein